jgi:hypothetical protein
MATARLTHSHSYVAVPEKGVFVFQWHFSIEGSSKQTKSFILRIDKYN